MNPRGIFRVLLIIAALGGVMFAVAPPADAATVDIVVDSTAITLSAGDSGTHVGNVTLANLTDRVIPLAATIAGDGGWARAGPRPSKLGS